MIGTPTSGFLKMGFLKMGLLKTGLLKMGLLKMGLLKKSLQKNGLLLCLAPLVMASCATRMRIPEDLEPERLL
ncbi:MAG: hypothetical protein ABIJ86_12935, partial [Spirochaetota bacterium]